MVARVDIRAAVLARTMAARSAAGSMALVVSRRWRHISAATSAASQALFTPGSYSYPRNWSGLEIGYGERDRNQ